MRTLFIIILIPFFFSCSKVDLESSLDYRSEIQGTYYVSIKHYLEDQNFPYMSEIAESEIIKDIVDPATLDIILFNDTLRMKNFEEIEGILYFKIVSVMEDYDEFGNKYLLYPSDIIQFEQKKYSGTYNTKEKRLTISLLKNYDNYKQNYLNGFVELEASKMQIAK